ncbi:DUF6817 domain-containing protein [Streptomyces sp. RKCA744]|uniref:DUF6817 domain-containing protein n=1 Tax=Streptomyces sp. RKCA744 TaxID=2959340 RepID=UPI00209D4A28|nr:hypothetical protein [Streptomyces sp. RKCA744]MCO8301753.1 hypothetical protein [Streptomyces sp. RKCA744]
MPAAPPPAAADHRAVTLLRRLGAAGIAHSGGTLLTHLQRVRARLAAWGARPELQLAGLCHLCYGTDGFPVTLLPLGRRGELVAVIGAEAEAIVYLYASCARKAACPAPGGAEAVFHDRFTGRTHTPGPRLLRDFAELSAAHALDLARLDPVLRESRGPELLALADRFRPLLSRSAWLDCHAVLAPSPLARD